MMHKILERQMERYLGSSKKSIPSDVTDLLHAVSDTYTHFDEDRVLVERSLDLSSRELMEINERLKLNNDELRLKTIESERFSALMIDRELRMVDLKKKIKALEKEVAVLRSIASVRNDHGAVPVE